MINFRKYGEPPFSIAVIHGGPGAPGEMAPVARELSKHYGVIEPLQTKDSLDGQVEELKQILTADANLPVTLIGHSWGAMLSFIVAARHPTLIRKVILVSSGVFLDEYAEDIKKIRLSRLTEDQARSIDELFALLN